MRERDDFKLNLTVTVTFTATSLDETLSQSSTTFYAHAAKGLQELERCILSFCYDCSVSLDDNYALHKRRRRELDY